MIDLAYFKEHSPEAGAILESVERRLEALAGCPTRVRLVGSLDAATRERILQLKSEVFGPGPEVFDGRTLDEVAADDDALLLTVEVDGSLEGFGFGYYETPGEEMVEGSAFFLDTGAMSARWRALGLGSILIGTVLVLLDLIGDVPRVGLAVWGGDDPDRLARLYRRFGFVDTASRRCALRCMSVGLDDDLVAGLRAALGVPPRPTAGARRADGGAG